MKISWLAFSYLFRGALFGDASSPHSARASFDRGFQGLVKLGMGPDCDHVRPPPRRQRGPRCDRGVRAGRKMNVALRGHTVNVHTAPDHSSANYCGEKTPVFSRERRNVSPRRLRSCQRLPARQDSITEATPARTFSSSARNVLRSALVRFAITLSILRK